MLRIFGNVAVLAAAMLAAPSFHLFSARQASAQEAETLAAEVECPDGTAGGCLHRNQIANCRPQTYGQPELFYNYYVPGTCGGVPAQLYVAPQPVPAVVGHTYFTYQPFMPHELLYPHHRTYYRYYNGGRGLTRTSVSWSRPPLTGWSSTLRIAR